MNRSMEVKESLKGADSKSLMGLRVLAVMGGTELFGHEKGNIEVFKALRDAGAVVRVGVHSLENGGAFRKAIVDLGFEVFTVPLGYHWSKQFFMRHPTLVFRNVWRVLRTSVTLLHQIREFKATHVHIGSPIVYSYAASALWMNQIPLVYRSGDKAPSSDSPLNRFFWKRCMGRANAVVANSQFVRRNLLEAEPRLRDKIVLIYNRAPETSNENSYTPEGDGFRHIVYLGQIAEHKGVSVLVSAAKKVALERDDVVFDFVGSSGYSKQYEQDLRTQVDAWGLADRLRFHGRINNPIAFMNSCILHVAPSVFEEPAANVVLEAKRAGIPSVVFPSGGLPELVEHGVDGYVCHDKTVDSLVDGISYFLDDENRRFECAQAATASLVTRFGDVRFVDEWTRVYNSVRKDV